MSKKASHESPADDWAGLAQNLFGIDLDKSGGDDDLLDEDMFKIELPPAPEPAVAEPVSNVVPTVAATSVDATASAPAKPKPPVRPAAVKSKAGEDSFGAGILDEGDQSADLADDGLSLPEDYDADGLTVASDFDDGLTLPPDHDPDDLTLPADYDDGLTLAPEAIGAGDESAVGDEEAEEDAGDFAGDPSADEGESPKASRSDRPRRRSPRRSREDAYWDMLENWEWEEIPEDDSPRGEGERSRPRRGDRDRRGRGGDRGGRDRGRDERPRSAERTHAEDRPRREQRRQTDEPPPRGESDDSATQSRRSDRSRDERGPRTERRPARDERRDEPRRSSHSTSTPIAAADDFGCGIFEGQPSDGSTELTRDVPTQLPPNEDVVAQSSQAADDVLRVTTGSAKPMPLDELVWPDDDSDVSPAPAGSVDETSRMPAAETAGESDRTVPPSDVEPLDDEYEARPRRPRRRRRRGSSSQTAPIPDGNEGTTFDLSDALAATEESLDFIPSASGDDSAVSAESGGEESDSAGVAEEDRRGDRRGGRRRRRRRFRPDEDSPLERPASDDASAETQSEAEVSTETSDEDEPALTPITYSNIPSWEEAIRYLLQPHLVGRNLGPDDDDEGLASDPRGSGGAEPTPPPPPPRRRRGGGRGRRP